jgi:hypothetical protein
MPQSSRGCSGEESGVRMRYFITCVRAKTLIPGAVLSRRAKRVGKCLIAIATPGLRIFWNAACTSHLLLQRSFNSEHLSVGVFPRATTE